MSQKRGSLIVFEGIDRSGKSTQSVVLAESLNQQGIKACHMRFPDRTTEIGKMISAYLQNQSNIEDHAIHLLFSANRWEATQKICQLLDQGTHVIVDRYAYSGVAYTAAKGYELNWCCAPDRGLPVPDMVIYLDLSVADAMKRGDFGGERYEKEEFQVKVTQIFQKLKDETWRMVDANQSKEDITTQIRKLADEAFSLSDAPLKKTLWL